MTPEEFWAIWQNVEQPKPIFYRVYYNDDGSIVCYTMEDLPGKYIDIDRLTYLRSPSNARVVNGQIVEVVPKATVRKLTPNSRGIACDPRDVCVIISEDNPHIKWSVTVNETD